MYIYMINNMTYYIHIYITSKHGSKIVDIKWHNTWILSAHKLSCINRRLIGEEPR